MSADGRNAYLLRKLPLAAREPELIEVIHERPILSFGVIVFGTACFTVWDVLLVLGWL